MQVLRPATVAPVGPTILLRISTFVNTSLSSNELEYLYMGKGFSELLFDSSELRRHPQGDMRISLTGNFGGNHKGVTAIFSSHCFILVSRVHTALISWPSPKNIATQTKEPLTHHPPLLLYRCVLHWALFIPALSSSLTELTILAPVVVGSHASFNLDLKMM